MYIESPEAAAASLRRKMEGGEFKRPRKPVLYERPSVGDVFIRDLEDEFFVGVVAGVVEAGGKWSAEINCGSTQLAQPRRINQGEGWDDKSHWRPVKEAGNGVKVPGAVEVPSVEQEHIAALEKRLEALEALVAALDKGPTAPPYEPPSTNGRPARGPARAAATG